MICEIVKERKGEEEFLTCSALIASSSTWVVKSEQKLVHETCSQAKSTFMTVASCDTHNNIFAVRIMHQHNTLKRRGTQFLIDCKINSILWNHSFISCQCWGVYQQSHIKIQSNLKWLKRKRWIIPYFWLPWRSSFEISDEWWSL